MVFVCSQIRIWIHLDAASWRGLLPPSAAHVTTMSADGAASAALRHHRHQPAEVDGKTRPSLQLSKMVTRKPCSSLVVVVCVRAPVDAPCATLLPPR